MKLKGIFLLSVVAFVFASCNINSSIMLKTSKNYQFDEFPEDPFQLYKISPDNLLQFQLQTNEGYKYIDNLSLSSGSGGNRNFLNGGLTYLVEHDGYVNLPVIGRVQVAGMTLREAELFLEEKFSEYYNKPFITLKITNRRVIIFPGSAGSARVLTLDNENTTLLEALAEAGGIATRGKANKIKLIRGDLKDPQIFLIDLSTIEGMKEANLVLQNNDIIYVEPVKDIARGILSEIAPVIGLITTFTSLIILAGRFAQ